MTDLSNSDVVLDLTETDLTASNVAWDLSSLLPDGKDPNDLMDEADALADGLSEYRGKVASLGVDELASVMTTVGRIEELGSRAGHWTSLRFAEDTADPERGAAMVAIEQRGAALNAKLLFVSLEWAAADPEVAATMEADPKLAFCAHHLAELRASQDHLLSEPEEAILNDKSVTGASAWGRLYDEVTSAIEVEIDGETESLEQALSRLQHPDPAVRKGVAEAITVGLEPGLKTRGYIFNTLLLDKSIDDRLRKYPSWISARNVSNEASDESVQALIDAVVARYDIPQRWYALKAKALGLDSLADYDRAASVAESQSEIGWDEATQIVRDSYSSFSPELASIVDEFIERSWIDAPIRPNKRGGAFCAYSVPSDHPYVLLNWTSSTRDVLTLAHELGHGMHAYLARPQGIFHQATPLTVAETASVFGETVTNNRLLSLIDDPGERFALLAGTLDDSIATVFRQVAMNRFEDAVHTERREVGELSTDRFGELWIDTQTAMLGPAVTISEGYKSWWSYIPHFIHTPGYVYAYAYGQLLALSVYARYQAMGDAFVPNYLDMLRAGGSVSPVELGAIVDCDLTDPGFWDAGLDIVEQQLHAAEEAATAAGRL